MNLGEIDERKGLPSASGMESYFLCLGKFHAEKMAEKAELCVTSTAAKSGQKIHSTLSELSSEELKVAYLCSKERDSILDRWLVLNDLEESIVKFLKEERLWLKNEKDHLVASGKVDFIAIADRRALILDYKTGKDEVEKSSKNEQLKTLAIILSENYDLDEITVGIIQPLVSISSDLHAYRKEDLQFSRKRLLQLLDLIQNSEMPRIGGVVQCRYCKIKENCSEAKVDITKSDKNDYKKRDGINT